MPFQDAPPISRRQFVKTLGAATTAAWLGAPRLFGQTPTPPESGGLVAAMRKSAATAKITVEKLRDNLSALIGSGGNIAVLSGKDGKLLVDAGMAGSQPQI